MKMQTTETTQGEGGGLREPGTFHVVINDVREGESQKGKEINGVTVTFEVLDGTVKGQQGKTHTESFFMPTAQDNEKNADMKLRKLTAMAIAGNVLQPTQLGTEADIPFASMVGKQMVVKFDNQMEMDGEGDYTIPSKYIRVSYSDFFHIDDPAVSAVPKNAEAVSLVDKADRHPEPWFAFKKKRATGQTRQTAGASKSSDASGLW
jgi:hypothetical protein